LTEVLQYRHM